MVWGSVFGGGWGGRGMQRRRWRRCVKRGMAGMWCGVVWCVWMYMQGRDSLLCIPIK